MASQTGQILDDQLESDRTRQFQEFLDDRVNLFLPDMAYILGNIHGRNQKHVGSKSKEINCLS
jgi:hypothetical protein